MKKYLIFILAAVSIVACKTKDNGTFTVTGKILNTTSDTVYLEEIPFAAQKAIVIDSTTLQNNSFNLKGIAPDERLFALTIHKGPQILLVNDSKNIEVTLDVNNFKDYQVKGSKASSSLKQLFSDYDAQLTKVKKAYTVLDSLQEKNANDSTLKLHFLQRDNEMNKLNTIIIDFVAKTESPAACLQALGMATRSMDLEELQTLAAKAVGKFKDNGNIQKFTAMLKGEEYPLLNKQAPEIALNTPEGKTVKLSDYKGKYVLVDFWASWCKPCRQENPHVVKAYNKYKDKNFTILGVSLDNDKKSWVDAIAKDNLTWTHISDLLQWDTPLIEVYKFDGIPFNVLIDPSGKIIATGLRGDALEKKLGEVLN
ncbi:MAG: AhpC/TSA family protein [Chitinophagaceae bacterium]|nr:AhpC/TSA family protein [Chitinophagaceae bacterium]MCW5904165.1 AhpC/TSA family protein [Chitinophagaceae bacterium]